MPPLDPACFDSPIVPCPAPLRSDAQRALVLTCREVEHAIANLRRRALELDEDVFALDVAGVAERLGEARGGLERGERKERAR